MIAYLTSFKHVHERRKDVRAFSIAMYQPKWYPQLPTLAEFLIANEDGEWTRPRNFIGEDHDGTKPDRLVLGRYAAELLRLYGNRAGSIARWVEEQGDAEVALCCWCPHDKAARRQLDAFGSFVCHSAAVEVFLKVLGVPVVRDEDRQKMVSFL